MTQAEWFAATNPDMLLRSIHPEWFASFGEYVQRLKYAVDARLRFFGCAAARMVWEFLSTDARSAVLISERVAASQAKTANLRAAAIRISYGPTSFQQLAINAAGWASAGMYEAHPTYRNRENLPVLFDPAEAGRNAAKAIATRALGPCPPGHSQRTARWHHGWTGIYNDVRATQTDFVRDIFPPPDYAPEFDPNWLTSTVVALARQADESGDFSIAPILADALQDAGCNDETLLQCCRVPGNVHVRGNWVVDLVLGRE